MIVNTDADSKTIRSSRSYRISCRSSVEQVYENVMDERDAPCSSAVSNSPRYTASPRDRGRVRRARLPAEASIDFAERLGNFEQPPVLHAAIPSTRQGERTRSDRDIFYTHDRDFSADKLPQCKPAVSRYMHLSCSGHCTCSRRCSNYACSCLQLPCPACNGIQHFETYINATYPSVRTSTSCHELSVCCLLLRSARSCAAQIGSSMSLPAPPCTKRCQAPAPHMQPDPSEGIGG